MQTRDGGQHSTTRAFWLISSLERAFEVGTDAVGESTANRVEIGDRDRVYGAGK